jgi:hypothetical protein
MAHTILDPQKKPDIFLIRGDSGSINFSLPGVDLTGGTVFFTAKPTIDADVTDAAAVIDIEVTDFTGSDPTNGECVIPLSATDTSVAPGIYYYDIQVKTAGGTIISIPVRKLEVFGDITRRIT